MVADASVFVCGVLVGMILMAALILAWQDASEADRREAELDRRVSRIASHVELSHIEMAVEDEEEVA